MEGERLSVYDGQGGFEPKFWNGVNLGATLPGHAPGELVPTEEDYLRWFSEMSEMNTDVVRVYTILNPEFYEAFLQYNIGRAGRARSRCGSCCEVSRPPRRSLSVGTKRATTPTRRR